MDFIDICNENGYNANIIEALLVSDGDNNNKYTHQSHSTSTNTD